MYYQVLQANICFQQSLLFAHFFAQHRLRKLVFSLQSADKESEGGGRFCVLWVILAIVGNQRADKESKAEDFVYFVFLGNLVIKEKGPINLPFSKPFDQNLICGIGVGSILMQQNTPEKQNTPENIHQSQSTKYNGGLVWLVKDTLRQQRWIGHCQKNLTWKGAFI